MKPRSVLSLLGQQKSFLKDAGILSFGVLIAQVIAFAALPFITRFYDPTLFGQFGVLVSVISILGLLTTFRAETLLPVIPSLRDATALFKAIMIWASGFCALLVAVILITPVTAWSAFGIDDAAARMLTLVPVLLWLIAAYSCLRFLHLRRKMFTRVAAGQIVRAITNAVATLASTLSAWSLSIGLVLGQIAGDGAFSLVLARPGRKVWVAWRRSTLQRMKAVVSAQAGMMQSILFSQIFATIYQRIPIFLIAAVYGVAPAGYYALAERLVAAPVVLLAAPIGDVYRQRAADHYLNSGEYLATFWSTLKLLLLVFIVPFAMAFSLLPLVFTPIFGATWEPALQTILILLAGGFATVICQPLDKGAIIVGDRKFLPQFHATRMVLETLSACLALFGLVDFHTYLICLVGSRIITYMWQVSREHGFAASGKRSSEKRSTGKIEQD